jgi:hypothetical protein
MAIDRAFEAGDSRTSNEARLRSDPRALYRGVVLPTFDELGIFIPRSDTTCLFLFAANLRGGSSNSPTYVVTQQGDLRHAEAAGGEVVLHELDRETTSWLLQYFNLATLFLATSL